MFIGILVVARIHESNVLWFFRRIYVIWSRTTSSFCFSKYFVRFFYELYYLLNKITKTLFRVRKRKFAFIMKGENLI